ncbi:hypothetical protein AMTR_s00125p00123750 [Amborella trichopoda]|uniref:FHA domain-containing protein n=1 Tax=Amborella trichopoda TaxID=13333 RepID=W1NR81_AMBTC|nr:hypothetical protein AMTR_s00125p00123750 [Amborella trichopoda]
MELQGENGDRIPLENGKRTELGRGNGSPFNDLTVSRQHVSMELEEDRKNGETRVSFQVLGKNAICVISSGNGSNGSNPRIYRRYEKGHLRVAAKLSVSLKNPYFYSLKRIAVLETQKKEKDEEEVERGVKEAVSRREKRTSKRKKTAREHGTDRGVLGDISEDGFVGENAKLEDLGLDSFDVSCIDLVKG